MGKANWFFNSRDNKWELRGRFGTEIFHASDQEAKFPNSLEVVGTLTIGGGQALTRFGMLSGTIGGIAAIGSAAVAVGTITGMTGLAVGDKCMIIPKAALAGNVGIVGAYVPTTNTLNAYIANTKPDSAGSLPHSGVDVLYFRTA